jgi:outer membrane immunogenic protein
MYKITMAAASVVALVGLSGAANAADLGAHHHYEGGLKDGPADHVSWTGFYVGAGLGLGASVMEYHNDTPGRPGEVTDFGAQGLFGTVQVGGDYRFTGTRFLTGVFFDYDFSNLSGHWQNTHAVAGPDEVSWKLEHEWSVGGRFGYLLSHDTLLYGLAAYTHGFETASRSVGNTWVDGTSGSKKAGADGWTLGAGLEEHLAGNWFLKGEYRFTSLNSEELARAGATSESVATDVHSVRAALTYKLSQPSYEPLK